LFTYCNYHIKTIKCAAKGLPIAFCLHCTTLLVFWKDILTLRQNRNKRTGAPIQLLPLILKKTAYLDNNVVVDIEQEYLTTGDLLANVDSDIKDFFYSSAHLQEATEMTAETEAELKNRLEKRFATISSITDDNYLYTELPTHKIIVLKEKPSVVYETINFSSFGVSAMKGFMSIISETQKQDFRNQIGIEPMRINKYSPSEIIEHINS